MSCTLIIPPNNEQEKWYVCSLVNVQGRFPNCILKDSAGMIIADPAYKLQNNETYNVILPQGKRSIKYNKYIHIYFFFFLYILLLNIHLSWPLYYIR